MSKRKDWADKAAVQIVKDVQATYDPDTRTEIVAARLHLVYLQGQVNGAQEARKP
jgi:hypothetical protein